MPITKINDETFLNPDLLQSVSFHDLESDSKARVIFTTGGELELHGDAAIALRSFLSPESGVEILPPSLESAKKEEENSTSLSSPEGSPFQWVTNRDDLPSHYGGLRRNKGWYYRADEVTNRAFFMAFVNAKGSCSLRMFDARTGISLPKQYQPGNYQDQFKELIEGATELTVRSQPNLERDCKERLPQSTFELLQRQIL